ncbi:MAG TPA: LuxR C-terminal-related transcriptional regulator [Actinomycetota bacterium]
MSAVRWIHVVSAIVWPASAALGLWRARSLIRRRTRARVYALMAVAIAVGAENLIQALSPHHPEGLAHLIANIVLAAAGVVALFVLAAYPEEIAHEERVLYALSRRNLGAGDGDPRPARPLSRRELEVLESLCGGLSTDEIAGHLSISRHTVATHVRNLMGKLGVGSRVDAVSWAIRQGIYDPAEGRITPESQPLPRTR